MNRIIAQRAGFYGLSFMTTEDSKEKTFEKFKRLAEQREDCKIESGIEEGDRLVARYPIREGVYDEIYVVFLEGWRGQPQEKPVSVYNSGMEIDELELLEALRELR